MNNKTNSVIFLIIGMLIGGLVMHFCSNYTIERKDKAKVEAKKDNLSPKQASQIENSFDENSIQNLTNETLVINYVKAHHELPKYYITKSEARKQGWNPSSGNLCDVLPGKAIGGDKFSNREKQLPAGAQYFEADVNYNCGNRGADRIVFTKDGEVWLTKNHYKSFEKQ